jgi:hypothetical protein
MRAVGSWMAPAAGGGGMTEESGGARVGTAARVLRCTKHDGERGKTESGSRGCSPRTANSSAGGGCGSRGKE